MTTQMTPQMTTGTMRAYALSLFQAGIKAADPAGAVTVHWPQAEAALSGAVKVHVIGIGKAAVPMVRQALARVPAAQRGTVLAVTNYENDAPGEAFEVHLSGHPVPDENGLAAGRRVMDIACAAQDGEAVLVLMSGGGSALLPAPAEGMTLEDKMLVTELLLGSGADITEVNTVRRALSQLKGGGLAELCAPARVVALVLSDVPRDVIADVASGPTVPGTRSRAAALAVLEKYTLLPRVPASALAVLNTPDTAPVSVEVANILIGGNSVSVEAAVAASTDLPTSIMSSWLDGLVEDAAAFVVAQLKAAPAGPHCLVAGGETTVVLRGDGRGGRNQEMALRVATLAIEAGITRPWVFLSGGTDGRDGPTDAAGGLVDPETLSRAAAAGVDVPALLQNNDSYAALQASGDLIMTGGTGTNVADLQILILG